MACPGDSACAAYERCLGQCSGDAECRSRCVVGDPVGEPSEVSALSACLASNCETACGLTQQPYGTRLVRVQPGIITTVIMWKTPNL